MMVLHHSANQTSELGLEVGSERWLELLYPATISAKLRSRNLNPTPTDPHEPYLAYQSHGRTFRICDTSHLQRLISTPKFSWMSMMTTRLWKG